MDPIIEPIHPPASPGAVDLLAVAKGLLATIAAAFFIGAWAILIGFAVISYEKRRHQQGYP